MVGYVQWEFRSYPHREVINDFNALEGTDYVWSVPNRQEHRSFEAEFHRVSLE
jgi:hypothetical protein